MSSITELSEPCALTSVAVFHELFGAPVVEGGPRMPPPARCDLRVSLLQEELNELKQAIHEHDLVECADALADLQYVLSGAVLEFGLHRRFKAIFDEVQRSNMSKACSTREEAEATVEHYKTTRGVDAAIRESEVSQGSFVVNRLPDNKVLKSIQYSAPQLGPMVEPRDFSDEVLPASKGVPEPTALTSVAAFHVLFGAPIVEDGPRIPAPERSQLRVSLLQEELNELSQAIKDSDLVECADALADLQYVLSGAVLEFGLHHCFKSIFDEVQRSNLSKACSTREEAEATVEHYKGRGVAAAEIRECGEAGELVVLRVPDKKVLKSVQYSPPQLQSLILAAETKIPLRSRDEKETDSNISAKRQRTAEGGEVQESARAEVTQAPSLAQRGA